MAFLPSKFMFHSHDQEDDHSPSTSLNILPPYPSSHQDFQGSILMKRSMSFSTDNKYDHHQQQQQHQHQHQHQQQQQHPVIMNGDDDLSDDESQAGDQRKKIRLNLEQVKALEKSFEVGNKLEPDRKMHLARSLNIQPRQVAIWFQNRRARWKTKQLERDYGILKKQFDSIKADNDVLHAHNKKLHAELAALRNGDTTVIEAININRETDQGSWSNGSDQNSSDNHHHVNLNISTLPLSNSNNNNNNGSISSQLSFKQLFPSSFKPASITQLLQTSTRSDHHCPKNDQMGGQDENFCNMFCGIDEQPGLWPWTEQHHQL